MTDTPVAGQTGKLLFDSVLMAIGRLSEDFVTPDTLVLHPRAFVKFALAYDGGAYTFQGGLAGALEGTGITVISDANVPTNLGTGTDESVAILGNFQLGAYFLNRSFAIEASRDAGWITDETVFRGVRRLGFACVVPAAFEVLSGIEA